MIYKNYTLKEISDANKVQSVLLAIANKQRIFFNITQYVYVHGLVRECGKTLDNKTNWILTEKGKQFLNVQLP